MVQLSVIEAQLSRLGVKKNFFTRPEIRELQHILMDHEQIVRFVQGRYTGGFAILVATEQRLLLVDKKPLYLTVEDIRYDMISEVDASARLFDASIRVFTVNKCLIFHATRQKHLRELTRYIQQRVMELRHYQQEAPQLAVASMSSSVPQPSSFHISHVPNPIPSVIARTRQHIPAHLPHAVGGAATKLASRIHNPNPYTKAPLRMTKSWSSWSDPITPASPYEAEA